MASDLIERLRSHMAMQDVPILLADCREAADTIERYEAGLRLVLAYRRGEGRFNFSSLPSQERDTAMFDAWQEVEAEVTDALRSQDKGEG